MDSTNFESEEECACAARKIQFLYSQIEWMPEAFKQVLKGKKHLPASKIRPSIFQRQGGFLGIGTYRHHFFGNLTISSLIKLFLPEKAKYSVLTLNLQEKGYIL